MAFCIKCGAQLNDGSNFCAACGNPQNQTKQGSSFLEAFPSFNFNTFAYLGYALISFILLFSKFIAFEAYSFSNYFGIFNLVPKGAVESRGMYITAFIFGILTAISLLILVLTKLINFKKLSPSAPAFINNIGGVIFYFLYFLTLLFTFIIAVSDEFFFLAFSWYIAFFFVLGGFAISFVPKLLDLIPKLYNDK